WADARKVGLGIRQWRSAQKACLHLLPSMEIVRDGLILDVGANVGDWTAAVLAADPSVTVIAVEPGDAPLAVLEGRFAHDARVTVISCAVGAEPDYRDFYVTEHSHNSSLRQPRAEMDLLYSGEGWGASSVARVEVTTVDAITNGRPIALLKVDVQGAELEVLQGACATLTRTSALLLEVTFLS